MEKFTFIQCSAPSGNNVELVYIMLAADLLLKDEKANYDFSFVGIKYYFSSTFVSIKKENQNGGHLCILHIFQPNLQSGQNIYLLCYHKKL